jgi:hypothetical protein
MYIDLHELLRPHFLYIAIPIKKIICLNSSFNSKELLYFLLFMCWACKFKLLPQVHYINNKTSYNKNSYAVHTNLTCRQHSCKWKEISDR